MDTMGLTYNYPELSTEGQPVLLLSVHNTQDRKLIKQFLPDSMAIETSNNGIANWDFDLCILDQLSFEANKQALQELKDEAAPIFLPFLLLSPDKKAIRNNTTVLEVADDVVYIPASPKLLQSRISLLLKQREYSLKLDEKNRELADEKRKYQVITENSTDMISRHAPDGTYLYVSPACKELTGYEPGDLLGQKPFDNMHPRDRKIFENTEELFTDKEVKRFTFRKGTIGGDYKWVESIMRPIVDQETDEVTEIQASTRDISERKEFEQKLKEEKDFIDKAIQSLPELFYMIDEYQNFIKWNNIERVLGYSDEEMQEMNPLDLFKEEDQQLVEGKFKAVFDTGFAQMEVKIKSKNDDFIPHLVTARKFSRGDRDFIVGTGINLSEIKEAQYDFEQQRQMLNAIINQTKSLIYVKDQDKKYRLVNESYVEIFEKDRENILGKTVRKVHGREFERRVEENDDAVLKHGKTVETEEAIPVHGETRYYHSIKYPLKGVPGYENCLCGISTDITELKKASKQLEESKNRWEKLVKNDPDLIMILVDREIKFINQAGAQILGAQTPEEIIGKPLDNIIKAYDKKLFEKREQKLLEGDPVGPVVHKLTVLEGQARHIKTQSTPITYEGNEKAIQIVGQDITGQIEYERELKESLKEKETLLQEIHHRVKNNLAVVSGMMDLQIFSTENKEVKRLLSDSQNRIKTMALIHEKLYQSASLSKIDFGSYVEDLLDNIQGVAAADKEIKVELESDSLNLNVNQAVPCALIINEVVANAYEHAFTDRESGLIKVSIKNQGDDQVTISIKDNGQGLPSDFEDQKTQSMGITIIETLIQQLEAMKKFEDKNGVSFSFSFEKQEIKGSSSTLV